MSISVNIQFADDVRTETGNKVSLMGIYTDGMFFGDQAFPVLLPVFSVYATVRGLDKPETVNLSVAAPDGQVIAGTPDQALTLSPGHNTAMYFAKISPMVFPGKGEYTFTLNVAGQSFDQKITVSDFPPAA